MTGYDNLDGGDDPNAGNVAEFTTSQNFLSKVPVVSINTGNDWEKYQYHNIEIRLPNGRTGVVQSWDQCSNDDCPPKAGQNCCDVNARMFGGNFLLDVEKRTLARLFGLKNYNNVQQKVCYRILGSFNPDSVASRYGSHRSK
eukprot:TRINITY_DN9601_c0_g1_i1.p2 TRINITY_DN9601_c0_g1~~TRINITY_DN9601_c0_g1_i1.p2  ORF type:complete len:142 (+),score=43.40 TRINITY_DN9601_c0_g1_i1:333-758(+)